MYIRFLVWGGFWGWLGFGAAVVGSVPVGLPLWLRQVLDVRPPAEVLGERVFRSLPPEAFGILVASLEDLGRRWLGVTHLAKTLALVAANGMVFALGAAGAWAADRWLLRGDAFWKDWARSATAAWAGWVGLVIPLAGGGFLASSLGPVPHALALLAGGSLLYGAALTAARGYGPCGASRA